MLKCSIHTQMKGETSSTESRKRDVTEIISETNFTNVSHQAKIFK